ncbi:ATP-binding protein [Streptomyces oceani]|uniref:Histidine kinase/HSP90-like ATPase domain-containing protein n=1 Tax=Streptomyces oceani TaxID=1075402 RepID=A0A1E7KPK5_9ACTN|nr:ATP-binding protein [Streptomyces oceani]OEV05771.1 hypothetical protein AN216_02190 [Streptomyces oceani]
MITPDTQSPTPLLTFVQRLSATRRGARLARLLAVQQFVEWEIPRGTAAHDDAALVVTELVSNAVLHDAAPGRDFTLRLTHDSGTGVVRVEVSDTHSTAQSVRPAGPGHTPVEEHGRGLLLVDALATRWGVRPLKGAGKTVWAEFGTEAPSEEQESAR